jgi:hypothetical protein
MTVGSCRCAFAGSHAFAFAFHSSSLELRLDTLEIDEKLGMLDKDDVLSCPGSLASTSQLPPEVESDDDVTSDTEDTDDTDDTVDTSDVESVLYDDDDGRITGACCSRCSSTISMTVSPFSFVDKMDFLSSTVGADARRSGSSLALNTFTA